MSLTSILEFSEQELQAEFWEHLDFDVLKDNAEKYKNEIIGILNSWKWNILKPLLKRFFEIRSRLHKWNIWLAFWDLKWAIEQYSQIKRWDDWFSQAQKKLLQIAIDNPTYFPQVSKFIEEISIRDWEFLFQKWYPYSFINLLLQDVWIRRDSYLTDFEWWYIVSLSQNENGMQEWKLSFLCIPYNSIDDWSYDWVFVNLEDLDILLHPKTLIFQWIDEKGNIKFSEQWRKRETKVSLPFITTWLRRKDTLINDNETEPVIVWEDGSEHVKIIQYWENHPQKILAQIRETLDYWLIWDASDMLERLNKKSPEYKIAKDLVEETAIESGRPLLQMTTNWEFPSWNPQ